MKLRCRQQGGNASGTKLLELPDNATLSSLISAVAALFGVPADSVQLSQNGRDPLSAPLDSTPDNTSVRSLGLVSGDLLYVRCTSGGAVPTNTPTMAQQQPASSVQHPQSSSTATETAATLEPSASVAALPILVGEVPDRAAAQLCPSLQLMQRLYNRDGNNSNQLLRFTLAVHCLMVETGFLSIDSVTGRTHRDLLGSSFEPSGPESAAIAAANRVLTRYLLANEFSSVGLDQNSYSIDYAYNWTLSDSRTGSSAAPAPRILLKVVRSGWLAMCHCAVFHRPPGVEIADDADDAESTELQQQQTVTLCSHSWHCNLDRFVPNNDARGARGTGYAHLKQLSSLFKDAIAERAKSAIHEACGLPLRGLTGLPTELLLQIMRSCHSPQAVVSLGEACRRLQMLHSDNYIWRPMLVRDYGSASERVAQYLDAERQGFEVNYYEAYRVFHEERVKRRRMLARLSSRELAPFAPAAPFHDMPGVLPPLFGFPPGPPALIHHLLPPEAPELPLRPRQHPLLRPDED